MSDDRDRRAAFLSDWCNRNLDLAQADRDLAALLTAARAEGAAEALRNVAAAFNGEETWTEIEVRDWLLAAAGPDPAGLVAVSVDSLKAALDIIDAAISESGNLSDGLTPDEADSIRPLRAALPRKEG